MLLVHQDSLYIAENLVKEEGFESIHITISDLDSAEDVFIKLMTSIPTNPNYLELHKSINYAALCDSLIGGIEDRDICVILNGGDFVLSSSAGILFVIYEALCYANNRRLMKRIKGRFKVILVGSSENFFKIDDMTINLSRDSAFENP